MIYQKPLRCCELGGPLEFVLLFGFVFILGERVSSLKRLLRGLVFPPLPPLGSIRLMVHFSCKHMLASTSELNHCCPSVE